MGPNAVVIHRINQGLDALRVEINKFHDTRTSPKYKSICVLLMGNLIQLESIAKTGTRREKEEADIVVKYLKELKSLVDSKITDEDEKDCKSVN